MHRPMKTGYSKLTVKSEALKYVIMDGDKIELPLRNELRLEVTETDIEVIKKDIERLEFALKDLKLKISKTFI